MKIEIEILEWKSSIINKIIVYLVFCLAYHIGINMNVCEAQSINLKKTTVSANYSEDQWKQLVVLGIVDVIPPLKKTKNWQTILKEMKDSFALNDNSISLLQEISRMQKEIQQLGKEVWHDKVLLDTMNEETKKHWTAEDEKKRLENLRVASEKQKSLLGEMDTKVIQLGKLLGNKKVSFLQWLRGKQFEKENRMFNREEQMRVIEKGKKGEKK